MNKAIVGASKSMLYDQELPRFLWEEDCNTTIYIQNMNPHKALGRKTPEEVFTGRRPEIGQSRIFGCLDYCHVASKKRTKLEATVEKGIFVGYSDNSKAYRLYIPSLRKTVVRRDVIFEEDRALRKSHDTGATSIGDQNPETQKTEDGQVTGVGTGIGIGTDDQNTRRRRLL
jgi:hypothetical protein